MRGAPEAGWPRGLLVAVATVAAATALLRSPLGEWGLDTMLRADGEPPASTAAFTAAAWLMAAAAGVRAAVPGGGPPGRAEASTAAIAVTTALALLAPLTLLAAGPDLTSFGGFLRGVLALELAVVAGGLAGLVCVRRAVPGPVVLAAALFLLLALGARAVVIGVFEPVPLIDPAGQVTERALDALRGQERWLPVASGAAALLATAGCALAIGRAPVPLLLMAAAPTLVRAAGALLGALWAGTPVLTAGTAAEWFYPALGAAAGTLTGLTRARARRPAPAPRSRAGHDPAR
ncbi:hypothetical protein [Actinomadura sp. 7K507]|uniref:hypothetical protein n=1 Tax=Actinomadura sp. 7K507 TaxID=2530365 RepID=UPI00104A586C|nr:hypothetical protein [Actinomadura sp. 7K507]TDC77589.1 hypothetical protein E1285_38520 [Actinomadura sp. 7K507]